MPNLSLMLLLGVLFTALPAIPLAAPPPPAALRTLQDWLQYSDEASPDYAETSESLWMESPEIDVEGDQAETAPRVSRALSGGSRPVSAGMWRQLLNDFVSNSRRFRGRTKKGPGRGCFGGKLDRIGALSGLGC